MHQYEERDGEEDRKPGGKTRVKDMESRGHTGQDKVNCGRVIFITNPATPDDGKSPRRSIQREGIQIQNCLFDIVCQITEWHKYLH